MRRILVVLYDSVKNPVFYSQVIEPLRKKMAKDPHLEVDILSHEADTIPHQLKDALTSLVGFRFFFEPRTRFLGTWFMRSQAYSVYQCILTGNYQEVIARGPFAAYLVQRAVAWMMDVVLPGYLPFITIQVRGLAAQEMAMHKRFGLFGWIDAMRARMVHRLEAAVYSGSWGGAITCFKAVSEALRHYVVEEFGAPAEKVVVDDADIPPACGQADVTAWRAAYRHELGIPSGASVYLYSGSYKKWQCVRQTLHYMKSKLDEDAQSFAVILSNDTEAFAELADEFGMDERRVVIKSVKPDELFKYLAVGDYGLLFREMHVVNWTARPTKVLEYQAVGLKVIHNGAVQWVNEKVQDIEGAVIDPAAMGADPKQISPS